MLFFVIGLPGAFADWCETVVRRLAERALGPIELIRADTLAQLALDAIGSGASQAVVSAHQPGGGLCAALAENRRNFIVARDDPRTALLDLVLDRGIGLADAVQAVASAGGALTRCATAPGALVLYRDRDWLDPAGTAFAIARHLGIGVDGQSIADLMLDLAADGVTRVRHDAVAWWSGLTADDQALVTGALAPFVEEQEDDGLMSLDWAADLFFVGGRLDVRARGPVDITGRAHCLLEGPHIMLPAGAWSLTLTLLLSAGAAEREFFVEVCADHLLATGTLPPQHSDHGETTLNFVLDETTERPLSIRVSTTRAAFDGTIAIGSARLVRAVPPRALTSDEPPALAGK